MKNRVAITSFIIAGLTMTFSLYAAQALKMPSVISEDLNYKKITVPSDLPGKKTLVIIAFQRKQQKNVDSWTQGMKLTKSLLPWVEMPVINDPGSIGRWFVNSGMRRGVTGTDSRAHVITVYTSKKKFLSALGITDETYVYALVVDRSGHVLAFIKGDYTPEGAQKILGALQPEQTHLKFKH